MSRGEERMEMVRCGVPSGKGGNIENTAWFIFFVDDAILVGVQWFEDGRHCRGLLKSLDGVYIEALGRRDHRKIPGGQWDRN